MTDDRRENRGIRRGLLVGKGMKFEIDTEGIDQVL